MAGVGANDVNPSLAAHDFAVLANLLDARSNFHGAKALGSVLPKATEYSGLGRECSRAIAPATAGVLPPQTGRPQASWHDIGD